MSKSQHGVKFTLVCESCLCHRKGNEFWANHNTTKAVNLATSVVFVTAKVMNFEQITTYIHCVFDITGCLCHRKGNEFWANHNFFELLILRLIVVFVTAKVMNFEQITTFKRTSVISSSCLCHRKGNEFWANHNRMFIPLLHLLVVFVTAKVMNFEQITT